MPIRHAVRSEASSSVVVPARFQAGACSPLPGPMGRPTFRGSDLRGIGNAAAWGAGMVWRFDAPRAHAAAVVQKVGRAARSVERGHARRLEAYPVSTGDRVCCCGPGRLGSTDPGAFPRTPTHFTRSVRSTAEETFSGTSHRDRFGQNRMSRIGRHGAILG